MTGASIAERVMSPWSLLFVGALALPASAALAEPRAPVSQDPKSSKRSEGALVHGKRHGSWRTHHPNGKLALAAEYRNGVPEGRWTSYYDTGRAAVVADFKAGVLERAANTPFGFLPDGTSWPRGAGLLLCYEGAPCVDVLAHIDFDTLPPLNPPSCPESPSGKFTPLARASWRPVLDGATAAWPPNRGGDIPGPLSCIKSVRVACAPDLDGLPGREVLAEVSYRLLLNSEKDCSTTDIANAWDMVAVVALSPPEAGRTAWRPRGVVGYPQCNADVCPSHDTITGFALLPSGETGIRVTMLMTGGECLRDVRDEIRTLNGRAFLPLATKILRPCP